MRFRETLKWLPVIFTLVLLACAGSTADVSLENGYPVITIENPGDNPVVIAPVSEDEGSIGYEANGEITWVEGEPEMSKDGKNSVYTWAKSGVTLTLAKDGKDVMVNMSLDKSKESWEHWYVNLQASDDEYFTGALERVVDGPQSLSWAEGIETGMNLRGEVVGMKLKPTVSAYAPFYISSNNYGFFAKGTWPGEFDFAKTNPGFVKIKFQGPELFFKIYRADNPAAIIQQHALDTGPSYNPPKWSLGPWRWRDNHVHRETYYDGTGVNAPYNSELVEDILMMKAYDIPNSAYWVDRPWAKGPRGFSDYEWDPNRFPNAQEMIDWTREEHGMEFIVWIAPYIMGDMANYAKEQGYHMESNQRYQWEQVLMDFTNEEAVEWWGKEGPAKLAKMGVKGFKLDRADGEKLLDGTDMKTEAGTTYRENFNDYPVQYVEAAFEGVKPILGDDFLLFPRAQYTGSAKYGGLWAGDIRGMPEGLRAAVIALQRCSVMGYPVWGSDIGGYGRDFHREVTMRWLGFGAFSPIMEVGPTLDVGFWDLPGEPSYDTDLIATWRLYAKVRMKLIDYISEQSKVAQNSGMPIARPLFMIYPEQEEAWNDWQTYLFGPDILVSIIWRKGITSHEMYLPAGEEWVDAWNREKTYKGGQYVEVDAPQHKTPIFIRKGADIALGDLNALYEESLEIASEKPDLGKLEQAEGWR
ncbi:MAG: alpha-glucosidase [Candidatus Marinimicrobia bacterium]|nr:alpha-glucosidase [Candidatus Neomarinimicrobiota bacterium]MCF7828209.1 alpha-glucosidase [Candidatus Neomarinimicrobiota bacterium]MCF7879616.1 alpha-glucosidase [Candidatus Neomarinimicrobiota bacterium]